MTSVAVLSPGYPDTPGGVTDHTRRLVSGWGARGIRMTVVANLEAGVDAARDTIRSCGAEALLLQYVPFLFGRRGLSTFPERLARVARADGVRVTVLVHEPWVPPVRLPWLVLSPLQRRQLRRLIRVADAVATPVPAWQRALGQRARVVYVGSTLGHLAEEPTDPPRRSPVVFSPFAAGLRWDWIVRAVDALAADPPLIVIGADAERARGHHAAGPWQRPEWEYLGRPEASEVLRELARAPLVLAPFIDGVTGRRTSIFAAASVGAPVLTSRGHLHDPFFDDSPLHVTSTPEEFAAGATALGLDGGADGREERRAWFDTHMRADRLDAQLLDVMVG